MCGCGKLQSRWWHMSCSACTPDGIAQPTLSCTCDHGVIHYDLLVSMVLWGKYHYINCSLLLLQPLQCVKVCCLLELSVNVLCDLASIALHCSRATLCHEALSAVQGLQCATASGMWHMSVVRQWLACSCSTVLPKARRRSLSFEHINKPV